MNWSSALSGWQWGILLSIPPLVFLLYFLKLKRQPRQVPSTYLWRRAMEDMHVNSLWQRLRRSLLLLLQLLFLAALILACLRPSIFGDNQTGRRWILMLDNSASMQASDIPLNRLQAAKTQAAAQLSRLNRGDVAMVMAFSDRADIRQGFTGDRTRLLAAVESIQPTQRMTDIREAMRAASGLANPGRVSFDGKNDIQVAEGLPAEVFVYSDGDFPPFTEFDRGNLTIRYTPIGKETIDNVSCDAFSVSLNEQSSESIEAYARLTNHGTSATSLTASLYQDDKVIDAVSVTIEPDKEKGISFEIHGDPQVSSTYYVDIDRSDDFLLDNRAYAVFRPARNVKVLVFSPGNSGLEKALSTSAVTSLASVQFEDLSRLANIDQENQMLEDIDLIVFDQCTPKTMPNANTLFLGTAPPGESWQFGQSASAIQVIDVDRSHPLTEYLELGNLQIVEGRTVIAPEGGQTLIRGDNGPIFCVAPRGPYQDAVLGFELFKTEGAESSINTDWVRKRSFPVFVLACVEFLGGAVMQSAATTIQPGQPMSVRLSSRVTTGRLLLPSGDEVTIERSNSGQLFWTQTDELGIYRIYSDDDQLQEAFTVNLFSPNESRLRVREDIGIGEEKVLAASTPQRGRQEYWRWLLALGLACLVGEWFVYHRRIFV